MRTARWPFLLLLVLSPVFVPEPAPAVAGDTAASSETDTSEEELQGLVPFEEPAPTSAARESEIPFKLLTAAERASLAADNCPARHLSRS